MNSNNVTCDQCGGYLPGHATGAADICECDPITNSVTNDLRNEVRDLRSERDALKQDLLMARNVIREQLDRLATLKFAQEDAEANAKELCEMENWLCGNSEFDKSGKWVNKHARCRERIRDLIAVEGKVGDLHEQRDALIEESDRVSADLLRLRKLLTAVLDAGPPHSGYCSCDQCNAFEAVRKELRGE